jgi:quinolinate synthase
LHVVYINTSLHTKSNAQLRIPTITCTSSNVVSTILQASAQIPNLNIFFGPDSFMGENLVQTFQHLASLSDSQIAAVHPDHNQESLHSLLERFDYFRQGNCVVHHMFDEQVTERLRTEYKDTFLTAHFEVPGAMFELSLAAQTHGRGKVGSTSDILNAITTEVSKAVQSNPTSHVKLPFVLGTEAGMITGIVRQVQHILREAANPNIEAEIIFPVASAAVSRVEDSELVVVPGVSSGEGCSSAGGCATCPFMKMNNLDSLLHVVDLCEFEPDLELSKYLIQSRGDDSGDAMRRGVIPINHMRVFQTTGQMSQALVTDVITRNKHLHHTSHDLNSGIRS